MKQFEYKCTRKVETENKLMADFQLCNRYIEDKILKTYGLYEMFILEIPKSKEINIGDKLYISFYLQDVINEASFRQKLNDLLNTDNFTTELKYAKDDFSILQKIKVLLDQANKAKSSKDDKK